MDVIYKLVEKEVKRKKKREKRLQWYEYHVKQVVLLCKMVSHEIKWIILFYILSFCKTQTQL